jgi:hypothetical protein
LYRELGAGCGLDWLRRTRDVYSRKEVNQPVTKKREKIKRSRQLAAWIALVTAAVALLQALVQLAGTAGMLTRH